jgi:hypothetical protein
MRVSCAGESVLAAVSEILISNPRRTKFERRLEPP